jgi:hypothetical protein
MTERSFQMGDALINHPQEAMLVGNIIARWSVIERLISSYLTYFMGADIRQSEMVLAALLNARAKIDLIEAAGLYALHRSELEEEFAELIKGLRRGVDTRNYYAHSTFAFSEKDHLVTMTPGYDWTKLEENKRAQDISRHVTVNSLKADLLMLMGVYENVIGFSDKLFASQPTLADGQQVPPIAFLRRSSSHIRHVEQTKAGESHQGDTGHPPPPQSSGE